MSQFLGFSVAFAMKRIVGEEAYKNVRLGSVSICLNIRTNV